MAELKGTKTEKNLKEAFAGESMARNKYSYFAAIAKKEGYEHIAAIFQETADNEQAHAKLHFKLLNGIGTTADNLRAAAAGELEEWTDMYPRMAKDALEDGFKDIAFMFEAIGRIEKHHQERYKSLLADLEAGTLFTKPEKTSWKCRVCGHIHEGNSAPATCPVCKHPQAHFELA